MQSNCVSNLFHHSVGVFLSFFLQRNRRMERMNWKQQKIIWKVLLNDGKSIRIVHMSLTLGQIKYLQLMLSKRSVMVVADFRQGVSFQMDFMLREMWYSKKWWSGKTKTVEETMILFVSIWEIAEELDGIFNWKCLSLFEGKQIFLVVARHMIFTKSFTLFFKHAFHYTFRAFYLVLSEQSIIVKYYLTRIYKKLEIELFDLTQPDSL